MIATGTLIVQRRHIRKVARDFDKQHRRRYSTLLCFLISIVLPMTFLSRIATTAAFRTRSTAFRSTIRASSNVIPTVPGQVAETHVRNRYNPASSRLSSTSANVQDEEDLLESGYRRPVVNWFPGHIAKAERQLAETLKAVDVVVEVRDARACKATAHPRVGEWCAGRPRIVVLTHLDMVPKASANSWRKAYESLGAERWDDAPINTQVANQAQQARDVRFQFGDKKPQKGKQQNSESSSKKKSAGPITPVDQVLFVNAKQGQGIHALHRSIYKAGAHVQERRERRGLKSRPLRVGIIGYPNVGKSALINRILGRRRARTANTPGVTRSLQWIRVRTDESKTTLGKEFELLDSPGIIPAKMVDQSDALLLAACNCIGQAAYDNQAVAAYLCEWLKAIHTMDKQYTTAPQWRAKCKERYGFDPMTATNENGEPVTGEDMLFMVADNTCRGDPEDASRKILQDFRAGRMGPISLQLAPESEDDEGQLAVTMGQDAERQRLREEQEEARVQAKQARAQQAVETAKERGLELPPMVENKTGDTEKSGQDDDIGKGMFDGW